MEDLGSGIEIMEIKVDMDVYMIYNRMIHELIYTKYTLCRVYYSALKYGLLSNFGLLLPLNLLKSDLRV